MKKNKSEILDSIITEAMDAGGTLFGGAAYGGSGTFSYSQQAGAKTWAPKSSSMRSTTADPHGYNVKDIGDEEHEFHHQAPKKRPFPLETINDFLAQAYIDLTNAEIQLRTCKKYNAILDTNMEKKALLKNIHKKTIAMKRMIRSMAEDLDRISFS